MLSSARSLNWRSPLWDSSARTKASRAGSNSYSTSRRSGSARSACENATFQSKRLFEAFGNRWSPPT